MTISVLRKAYCNDNDLICCIELIIYSHKIDILFSLYDHDLTQFLLKNIDIQYDDINDLNKIIICIFTTLCHKYVPYCKIYNDTIEQQIYNIDILKKEYHIQKTNILYYDEISATGYGKITKLNHQYIFEYNLL